MIRWLPYPALALLLVVAWLLLNESVGLGSILLGCLVALLALGAASALELPSGTLRRPRAALRLSGIVLRDIFRSNFAVCKIVLRPTMGGRTSGFLRIPLDMRSPYGLAALSCILTATPGTIWVAYDSTSNSILLHILDLVDEQVWLDTIKGRYERHLMEIFE